MKDVSFVYAEGVDFSTMGSSVAGNGGSFDAWDLGSAFNRTSACPDCNRNAVPDECDGGCPPGQEQPMDDMTTDFMTDNAQGHPCGDCGKMDPLWFLMSVCAYVGLLFARRR